MWNYALRGAGLFDKSEMPPKPEHLPTVSKDAWELLYCLSKFNYAPSAPLSAGNAEAAEAAEESKDET